MTVFEMQGVLLGKAIPGDIKVNESLAAYLVRKLADAEARGVEKLAAKMKGANNGADIDLTVEEVEQFAVDLREGRA